MSQPRVVVDAIERHWAVAAISADNRRLARAAADGVWEALLTQRASRVPALHLEEHATLISELATAYERAALERVDALTRGPVDDPDRLHAELEAAAAEAFALFRALPIPDEPDPARLLHLLRVAAIAVVGDSRNGLEQWLEANAAALDLEPRSHRWDALLRARLAAVWLDLLRGPAPGAIERSFETLGNLREQRAQREAELLASLPAAAAQQMRLHLFALYYMADAAAALTLHGRRGPLPDTVARIAADFEQARAVTLGDMTLDVVLQWLDSAAQRTAVRQTAQMELPGINA